MQINQKLFFGHRVKTYLNMLSGRSRYQYLVFLNMNKKGGPKPDFLLSVVHGNEH